MTNRKNQRLFVLFCALFVPAVLADTVVEGQTASGAYYRIVVPDTWNGRLVIWNHGYTLSPAAPLTNASLGPLVQLQLVEGYAVAASSYQQNGWALFKTKADLKDLMGIFKSRFGQPNEIIVTGASLGGLVTAALIEDGNLGNLTGAYSLCGAMAGSRNWDFFLDLRLVYDAVCANTPEAAIAGGAGGLPKDSTFTAAQLGAAVNACTGILQPPATRTAQQNVNLARILGTVRIPGDFLLTDMYFATFGLQNLTYDQGKLAGRFGVGNANVDYGDAEINAEVTRVTPNPGAAIRLENNYTPTGNVGQTKIISVHTDKDGLVIVENESEYASVVPPANLTTAVVVESAPVHCGFTPAEIVAGWESLRGWLSGAPQPTPGSIQATCSAIAAADLAAGPCRIDPGFVIPDMDGRVRPR